MLTANVRKIKKKSVLPNIGFILKLIFRNVGLLLRIKSKHACVNMGKFIKPKMSKMSLQHIFNSLRELITF